MSKPPADDEAEELYRASIQQLVGKPSRPGRGDDLLEAGAVGPPQHLDVPANNMLAAITTGDVDSLGAVDRQRRRDCRGGQAQCAAGTSLPDDRKEEKALCVNSMPCLVEILGKSPR